MFEQHDDHKQTQEELPPPPAPPGSESTPGLNHVVTVIKEVIPSMLFWVVAPSSIYPPSEAGS